MKTRIEEYRHPRERAEDFVWWSFWAQWLILIAASYICARLLGPILVAVFSVEPGSAWYRALTVLEHGGFVRHSLALAGATLWATLIIVVERLTLIPVFVWRAHTRTAVSLLLAIAVWSALVYLIGFVISVPISPSA